MQKTFIWMVCILMCITDVNAHPVQLKASQNPTFPDSTRLYNLIFLAHRTEAAEYLTQYLYRQNNKISAGLAPYWLDLAMMLAWSDSLASSKMAFNYFTECSKGQPDYAELRANRLLYHALYLAATKLNNQAADSLIASIAIRPAFGSKNQLLLADSYGKLARLYKKTGDLFESSRNFDRSISLNRELSRTEILADDLSELSPVLSTINPLDPRADSLLSQSLLIFQKAGQFRSVAQVLNEFGVLFNRRGKISEAIGYFKQSLAIKSKIPDLKREESITVINNIGHCYQYLGNNDSARYYFSKAVDYAIQSKKNPAPYLANLGANYGINEENTLAIQYFQKALNKLDPECRLEDPATNPSVNRATTELADFTAYKAHAYHRRFHQFKNPRDLIDGLNSFMVALEMIDTLRFMYSFDSKPYLSSDTKIHFFTALDMALDLYQLSGDHKYLDQAFLLSERNKSATLNEFLRTNQARNYLGSVAPWITIEDSIKLEINRLQSKLIGISTEAGYPPDSINKIQARISGLLDELKNVGIAAKRENPQFFKMVFSSGGYPPGQIQKLLVPGEALIDYTVVRNSRLSLNLMTVMVMTRDTLFTFRDTLPDQFRVDIKDFRASITSYVDASVFRNFVRLSHRMYEYFVHPVEQFKGVNKLVILPDEELGFLPFEVFVSDTIQSKESDFRKLSYLNRKYQISYISSHEQLYQFRSETGKRPETTIHAFAPFVDEGIRIDSVSLYPLKNSAKEINYISKIFRTKAYKGKKAGEKELRKAFQQESVIMISTHGIISKDLPMQSRLLMNPSEPDFSLYFFEMISLKIKSQMVLLNACNSGTGELQVGEGIMSMARGFQIAGVPTVITTLWPIDDQSSAAVMKYFFQNLGKGMDQREALMQARNSYIDQATKATAAPYFWAGEVIIGNPGQVSIHKSLNHLLLLSFLAIFVLLAGAIIILYYKKVR